jgi:hypothetical protein
MMITLSLAERIFKRFKKGKLSKADYDRALMKTIWKDGDEEALEERGESLMNDSGSGEDSVTDTVDGKGPIRMTTLCLNDLPDHEGQEETTNKSAQAMTVSQRTEAVEDAADGVSRIPERSADNRKRHRDRKRNRLRTSTKGTTRNRL